MLMTVALHEGIHRPEPGTGCVCVLRCELTVSIKIHFKDSQGKEIKTVEANEGDDLLSVAHEYDIDLEGIRAALASS